MNENWRVFALGSAFFAGLTAVLAKVGVERIPSNLATLIRTIVVGLLLILLVQWRGEWQNPIRLSARSLLFLVLSGLATGLSWICYFRALQLGQASLVAPIDKLSLPIAVVLAVFLLREHLSGLQWAGTVLMAAGALLVGIT
jgi:transporter family protein